MCEPKPTVIFSISSNPRSKWMLSFQPFWEWANWAKDKWIKIKSLRDKPKWRHWTGRAGGFDHCLGVSIIAQHLEAFSAFSARSRHHPTKNKISLFFFIRKMREWEKMGKVRNITISAWSRENAAGTNHNDIGFDFELSVTRSNSSLVFFIVIF